MTKGDLLKWRYYFLDLPLFSCGMRSSQLERRLHQMFETEKGIMRNGFMTLCDYLGRALTESEIATYLERTFWVKVIRESDAFTSLRMSKRRLDRHFQVEGIENVETAVESGRPVVLLSGHFGSFYTSCIAFGYLGLPVCPVAKRVVYSPLTPLARSLYEEANYKLTGIQYKGKYIFTNDEGRISREIVALSKTNGLFFVAIDLPSRLYVLKRSPVSLFGRPGSLPAGVIDWGIRKNALFLTTWNFVEGIEERKFYRRLIVEKPIPDGTDTRAVLQAYADRLTNRVIEQPWQWVALQVIHQFYEGESENG